MFCLQIKCVPRNDFSPFTNEVTKGLRRYSLRVSFKTEGDHVIQHFHFHLFEKFPKIHIDLIRMFTIRIKFIQNKLQRNKLRDTSSIVS